MTLTNEDLQAIASLMDAKLETNNEMLIKQMDAKLEANNEMLIKQMDAKLEANNERFDKIESNLTSIKVTLENDIVKMVKVIGEGHDFLKMRLDGALKMEKKREDMEIEIIRLRMQVNNINELLNIS